MTDLVKNESSIGLMLEVTEGVYVAPAGVDDMLEVLASGAELSLKRDVIERSVLSSTIEEVESRAGMRNVNGNIPVEFKAGKTAGDEPREKVLYRSLLGGKRSSVAITTGVGNTSTVLHIDDGDIAKLNVNDMVLIKRAGKFEVRPIIQKDSTPGTANVTLLCALDNGAPGDHVVLEAFTTYFHDKPFVPFSTSYFAGGAIKEAGVGCKCISGSLENWETGKIPNWKFAIAGLDMTQSVEAPAYSPDFTADAKAPTMFAALAYIDGISVDYNKIGLTLTNEKSEILSAARASGKKAQRKTKFTVEATIDPYKSDADVARFNSYNANQKVSLFSYAFYDDGSTPGEFKNVVAFFIPQAKITDLNENEKNGVLVEELKMKSFKKLGKDSVFLGFI